MVTTIPPEVHLSIGMITGLYFSPTPWPSPYRCSQPLGGKNFLHTFIDGRNVLSRPYLSWAYCYQHQPIDLPPPIAR